MEPLQKRTDRQVAPFGGYQGSPILHLIDVLADAKDVLDEPGVNFQSSANESSAAAMLSTSVMYRACRQAIAEVHAIVCEGDREMPSG